MRRVREWKSERRALYGLQKRIPAEAILAKAVQCSLPKSYGERLRGCNPRNMNGEKAQGLSPELQAALEPLLATIESLTPQKTRP